MSTSQNGWPVDTSGAKQDRAPILNDITVPNGVLSGDVAVVFRWLAAQYDARVERLIAGTCWGWYVKTIEGSTTISNHASGTAVDFNADEHPMGTAPAASFSAAQIAACRAIVAEAGGVLRWGGDYTGRKDGMHWEINTNAARVKAFADKIREADVNVDDLVKNSSTNAIPETPVGHYVLSQGIPDGTQGGRRVAAWQAIENLGQAVVALQKQVADLAAKLS